jgi:IS30 family transposase
MAIKYTQLTLKERYNLEFLIQEGFSNKNIALRLCRDKSTIAREIRRNSVNKINYSADIAPLSRALPLSFLLILISLFLVHL